MNVLRDLGPLFKLQGWLLLLTLTFGGGNFADARVQAAWLLFLMPGWLLAPFWVGDHAHVPSRSLVGLIVAIGFHGMFAACAAWLGLSMTTTLCLWIGLLLTALVIRQRTTVRRVATRMPLQHQLAIGTLMVFCVAVYRTPPSNDITQFILQQQDMLAADSMQASAIGMEAFGVDEPMPRWRAHYWHLLPCLIAKASGVAVDQVLFRYGTIPVAFSVLFSLLQMVRYFTRRRASMAMILLAMLGPVLLYYRNFCVFNYSFRVSNNLLLDKDFALFFLVPAVLFVLARWLDGKQRSLGLVCLLIPAILRFHPLTPVYLMLGLVLLLVLRMPISRGGFGKAMASVGFAASMFVAVVWIGDAQGNHEQIQEILRLDHGYLAEGRPLHYWIGFYNTIENSGFSVDTTAWSNGRLHVKASLYLRCGMLLVMQLASLALCVRWCFKPKDDVAVRSVLSALLAIAMLWGMWFVSGAFLTSRPHYAAGYERLHWFVYWLAITVVAMSIASMTPRRWRRLVSLAILIGVLCSATLYRLERRTALVHVRGLNSLLDQTLPDAVDRRERWDVTPWSRTLADLKPDFLEPKDRVLLVSRSATGNYWFTKQGVFWCDPYVEAFALTRHGDAFLRDRRVFYSMLDRQPEPGIRQWLVEKRSR